MSLKDRIPVEPLDSARLERIEQRIVAEARPILAQPRRTPWASWILAGAAAAAVAALVIVLGVGRQGGAPAAAPTIVATDAQGTRIDLGDAVVDVGPDTRFEVVRAGGGVDLRLARGDVSLEVPPRRGRPPLWVHAGDVGVRVVGTGFRVRRHDTVEVEVTHGAVEVHRGVALARVATGERWSSTDGAVVAIAAVTADRARPATGAAIPAAGSATIPADELALAGSAAGPDLRDRRAPALGLPATASRPGPAADGAAPRVERPRRDPASTDVAPVKPVAPPLPDLRAEVLAQPIDAGPILPPGVVASTPVERAHKWREMAFNPVKRDDADVALWGLAHTQATALGQEKEAMRTLDLYMRRFPSGLQLEQVLWLRLRILCKRELDASCRAAAHTYVKRYPGKIKGELAIRVTNTR